LSGGGGGGDARVESGETTQLDPDAQPLPFGSVTGALRCSGRPADGYTVELKAFVNGAPPPRRAPLPRRRFGAAPRAPAGPLSATTDRSGRFSISQVPAGRYLALFRSARATLVHEQEVAVAVGKATELPVEVETARLVGRVLPRAGEDAAALNGSAALLRGLTEEPDNLDVYVRKNGSITAIVQRGEFRFDDVKPGSYLLLVTMRKRARAAQAVTVTGDAELQILSGEPNKYAPPDPVGPGGRSGGR
jgi:hypothetical protein